ncbi:MAG TPA: hypothetical protein VFX02_14180 [Gammaproteobacteria bacterium]|nr:hypothetical protein [Gammaproteobacteria bacterium]
MDIKRLSLIASLLIVCVPAQACPEQPPAQRLQEAIQAKKDLALVEVAADTPQAQPASDFAILKVIQGWGASKRRHLTYAREESSCGPLEKLDMSGRYLVVLELYKVTDIFEYSAVKKLLKPLGGPDYKYNRKGKLIRKSAN